MQLAELDLAAVAFASSATAQDIGWKGDIVLDPTAWWVIRAPRSSKTT
jgi:hypothetical protein